MDHFRAQSALCAAFLGLCAAGLAAGAAAEQPKPAVWEPLGLCGGGCHTSPAISPHDPKLMLISSDMGAAYRSTDGGVTWRMIHYSQLKASLRCRPVFHPTDPNVVFASDGQLKVSRDRGEHWAPIGDLRASLRSEIAMDAGRPELLLAGAEEGAWRSTDGGKSWAHCAGPKGEAVGLHIDQTSPPERRVCFVATRTGLWRSDDGGAAWTAKDHGLPWKDLLSFAGGSNAAEKRVMLYVSAASRVQDGRFAGGVYRSADRGETWESAMGEGINKDTQAADEWAHGPLAQYKYLLATNAKPLSVWAMNTSTGFKPPHHIAAFRSDDAGKSWRATFYPEPRWKECNHAPDYLAACLGGYDPEPPRPPAINPADPDQVIYTQSGRSHITTDGGKTWKPGFSLLAPGQEKAGPDSNWLCNGLVVTSTWHYYADPFEPARHYIAYTDIGFARSLDGGLSWKWWTPESRAPWRNTCYELACDPQTPGKLWGAFSDLHDVPNANIVKNNQSAWGKTGGGVCVSTDFGATWKASNEGLPVAPALSVVLDPKSPQGRRVLYAGVFGQGVFKTVDDGRKWTNQSAGLGAPSNLRVCRVQLHPDGTLFALLTGQRDKDKRFLPEGVGLYRSRDGAESWQLVNASQPFLWPKDFTVDPKDSRVLYVGASDANKEEVGGLYRTTDGGATWKRLARKGREHFGAYLHPKHPGWIYMTLCEDPTESGLWLSKDDGQTWAPLTGLPFANIQRVEFLADDPGRIYVTTFGGSIWRGPADEGAPQP